jgi:hypothetical protein
MMQRNPAIVRRAFGLLVVVLALTAGACAGDSDMAELAGDASDVTTTTAAALATTTSAPETTLAAQPADRAFSAAGAAVDGRTEPAPLPGTGGVVPALQPREIGRDIVFTADITVAVRDVATASEQATRTIEQLGGLLFGQRSTGGAEPQSVLTFKVFPEDFAEALDRLGSIGEIRSQNVSADDVTERIVDLESRIKTAVASVERLQALLDEAGDITTIAQLEAQLLQRETDLERLRGQLRTLEDAVSLATIVLTITQAQSRPELTLVVTAFPGADELGVACPGEASLTVDEGTVSTLCIFVRNAGDTALTSIEIRDTVLDLETSDLVVVYGEPEGILEPGDSVLFTTTVEVAKDLRLQTTATAVPVDDEGAVIAANVADTSALFMDAVDPGGLPGFSDAVSGSWDLLKTLGAAALVALGAMIPFLWVFALLGAVVVWRRRRRPEAPLPPVTPEAPTSPA